jgi:tetratricopeptide (TPR) repeat protein
MGLFNFFIPKSFEDMEAKADRLAQANDLGLAKLEYEKSLERLHSTSGVDVAQHQDRINAKIRNTCETLAQQHVDMAKDLVVAQCAPEAAELLSLARDLSNNRHLHQDIDNIEHQIESQNEIIDPLTFISEPADPEAFNPEDEDGYFQILLSTMPDEIQSDYLALGKRFQTGYLALNQGEFALAAELLGQVVAEQGDHITYAHLELANAYLNLGQIDTAADLLEEFVDSYPWSVQAYECLCEIYWERGDIDHADRLLQACPDELKRSVPILLLMGETLHRSGDFAKTTDFYLKAIEYLGWQEPIAIALARTHEAADQLDEALGIYQEVVNNCKSCHQRLDPYVRHRYAELLYSSGETSSELLDSYFALCSENPKDQHLYYQRISDIYDRQGYSDEARRYSAIARQVESRRGDVD